MTSAEKPDFNLEYLSNYSMLDISPDSEPLLNLIFAMLFPSAEIDREQREQFKKIFDIQQRSSSFAETQAAIMSRPRALMGAKSARLRLSAEEAEAHKIKNRRESEIFDVLSLVATLNDLPETPYKNEISNRTTEGVLAGSMLLYIHTYVYRFF